MTATGPIARAEALVEEGDWRAAIELLTDRYRALGNPGFAERLVRLRHESFVATTHPPVHFESVAARPTPSTDLPFVDAADLDADVLRTHVSTHGCVGVRGLVDRDRVAGLVANIDRTIDAYDAGLAGAERAQTSPWYRKFTPPGSGHRMPARKFIRASGGVWTVDSPHMLVELCSLLHETGIADVVTEYLGERPALSANKCNLRRVPPSADSNWHQDGAFLGRDIRSVNLWLSLSHCGDDAPSLDVVPRRLDDVVETGTDGAVFDWSVAHSIAEAVAGERGIERLRFAPGDALLFDHLLLHRTGVDPSMTASRYALETWMFAPSVYPAGQIPVML